MTRLSSTCPTAWCGSAPGASATASASGDHCPSARGKARSCGWTRRSPELSEEFDETARRLVGSFLWDEVPDRDRTAGDVVGPGLPDLERLVPAGDGGGVAPERKRRAGDPPLPPVGFVVLVVERCRGAV